MYQCHVYMYEYYDDVDKILVLENFKTPVVYNEEFKDWQINNGYYQEMTEYYGTAIILACIGATNDK